MFCVDCMYTETKEENNEQSSENLWNQKFLKLYNFQNKFTRSLRMTPCPFRYHFEVT